MNYIHLLSGARSAGVATLLIAALGLMSFVVLEPIASRAAETDTFTVQQSITAEISITTPANDVTMTPTIPGVTGGTSYGTTSIVVNTNNANGYTMTIEFSSSTAMNSDSNPNLYYISNYTPSNPNLPDYSFTSPGTGQAAEFAYTVSASTTSDLDQTFLDNTSVCGTGAADTGGSASCWYNASTSGPGNTIAEQIVDRGSATEASGATTSIMFRVTVPNSPTPALPVDTYTATATLTATAT